MTLACEVPLKSGPAKGLPATGTRTGATRHHKAGEKLCAPCHEAQKAHFDEWVKWRDHHCPACGVVLSVRDGATGICFQCGEAMVRGNGVQRRQSREGK